MCTTGTELVHSFLPVLFFTYQCFSLLARCTGALLTAIARNILHLPVMRYVDDFFSVARKNLAETAMNIFARLVRVCMGTSAIAAHKLGQGTQLVVLGIELSIKASGLTLWPSEDKVTKWTHRITRALREGKLSPGDASKLSGALQWATQAIFKKLGRAMIRPIIKQSYARWSKIGKELELALRWWLEVLQCGLRCMLFFLPLYIVFPFVMSGSRQERLWQQVSRSPVHLYSDARSTPPRVAAVLIRDGYMHYCDMEPDEETLKNFRIGGDKGIMSLELLSIALGPRTALFSRFVSFAHFLL